MLQRFWFLARDVRRPKRVFSIESGDELLDPAAVGRRDVHFTQSAIITGAGVFCMPVCPASPGVARIRPTTRAPGLFAPFHLPAREKGLDPPDAGDPDPLAVDRLPDAANALNVRGGIPPLSRGGLERKDQPLALVHPEGMDGNPQDARGGTDGKDGCVRINLRSQLLSRV
jgi:hypothetical protein